MLTPWSKQYRGHIPGCPAHTMVDKDTTMQYNVVQRGVDVMAFSIRLTDEEKALAESYARLHSMSLAEAFKRALFERIEDEYDVVAAEEAYSEYVKNGKKSRPISELWKELDL